MLSTINMCVYSLVSLTKIDEHINEKMSLVIDEATQNKIKEE